MKQNKKIFNKLLGCTLFLTTLMSAGCDFNLNSSQQNNNAEIYSCYITDKVLQNVETNSVKKQEAKFSITAAIGETESAQVIICPEKDVNDVRFSVGTLTSAEGVEFSSENINVYYQKYIEVYKHYHFFHQKH